MTVPSALMLVLVAAWAVAEAAASSIEPHVPLPRELATGLALFAAHAGGLAEHLARAATPPPAHVAAGAALFIAGAGLRVSAIRALGPRFVSIAAAPDRVITRGPYRVLRHPSELGLLATGAGAALLLGSVLATALTALALLPLSLARCAAERPTPGSRRPPPSRCTRSRARS